MKTIKFLSVALFFAASLSINAQGFVADAQKSKVKWLGTKVLGKHFGTIALKSGEMTLKGDKLTAGSFVIDMNSIVCEDISDPKTNQNLVGHLKSDDFFGVANFPEAKLVIKSSTAFKANKANVTGDMTIKGKTNPVSFEVTRSGNTYTAKIVVDRSKYDVRYGSKSFFDNLGDKAISDDFELDVNLVVIKK
jgi:polyisoprenoid-binding protein YceI